MAGETITIYLNTTAQTQGISTVVTGLDGIAKRVGLLSGVLGGFQRQLIEIATVFSVVKLVEFTKHIIQNADAMEKMAQKAGLVVEEFTALSYSARLSNVDTERLITSTKGLSEWLQKTGQSGRNFRDVLFEQADLFARMPNGLDKVRMAQERFGRAGLDLIPWLNKGSQAIREEMEEAERFGAIIGPRFAANADRFLDNLERIGNIFKGIFNLLADALLPEFIKLQESFINWVKSTDAHLAAVDSLIQVYQGFATVVAGTAFAFRMLQDATAFILGGAAGNISVTGSFKEAVQSLAGDLNKELERFQKRMGEILDIGRRADKSGKPIGSADVDTLAQFKSDRSESDADIKRNQLLVEQLKTRHLLVVEHKDLNTLEERSTGTLMQEYQQIVSILEAMKVVIHDRRLATTHMENNGLITSKEARELELQDAQELLRINKELLDLREKANQEGFFERLGNNMQEMLERTANAGKTLADVLTDGIKGAFDSVGQSIWGVIEGTTTWGQVFMQVGRQMLSQLVSIALMQVVVRGAMLATAAVADMLHAKSIAKSIRAFVTSALAGAGKSSEEGGWVGLLIYMGVLAASVAAIMGMAGGFEKGGVVPGGQQIIRVNESGTEAVLNARATRMLGENTINMLNSGVTSIAGLESRIASNMSLPSDSGSFATDTGGGGSVAAIAGGSQAQDIRISVILVDSRNSQAAKDFILSSKGRVVIAEVSRDQKMEIGIS